MVGATVAAQRNSSFQQAYLEPGHDMKASNVSPRRPPWVPMELQSVHGVPATSNPRSAVASGHARMWRAQCTFFCSRLAANALRRAWGLHFRTHSSIRGDTPPSRLDKVSDVREILSRQFRGSHARELAGYVDWTGQRRPLHIHMPSQAFCDELRIARQQADATTTGLHRMRHWQTLGGDQSQNITSVKG